MSERSVSAPPDSRRRILLRALNPLDPTAGYVFPHAIVLIVIGLILVLSGVFVAQHSAAGGYGPGPLPPRIHLVTGVALPPRHSLVRFIVRDHNQGQANSCVSQTIATILEMELREQHRRSPWLSGGYLWNRLNGGQDVGISYEQAFGLLEREGEVRLRDYPNDGRNVDLVTSRARKARHWRALGWRSVSPSDRRTIETELLDGRPLALAIPVTDSFYNQWSQRHMPVIAKQYGAFHFYHSVTGVAYGPTGVEILNSWPGWGYHQRAVLTWDFLRDSNAAIVASAPNLGPSPSTPILGPAARPMRALPVWHQPFARRIPKAPKPLSGGGTARPWHVGGIRAADVGIDLAGYFNAAGDYYHISPVGLAATFGSECSLNTTSPTCDRWGAWPDVSFGGCQVTVATAGGFGVGSGQPADAYGVRSYEDVASQCIWLEARIMAHFRAYTGVDYPQLNVAWNCGPGWPTAFLLNPQGECWTNYQHFLGWWQWALSHAVAPTPPQFPLSSWNGWTRAHHKAPVPARWHGRLTTIARSWWHTDAHRLDGQPVQRERYHRHGRYMSQRFSRGIAYSWPKHPKWGVAWKPARAIGGYPDPYAERCATVQKGCVHALVDQINSDRAAAGLPPYVLSWPQSHCSKAHSVHMAQMGQISHDQFPSDVCLPWSAVGENVGESGGSKLQAIMAVHELMMSEPHDPSTCASETNHACNLLSPSYRTIGIGLASSGGSWYLTEDFVG